MVRLMVKEVAQREGIRNPLDLATRTGLHYQTVYSLWRGESKQIGLKTIEKLCRTLGVRPGQLFQLDPDIGQPGYPTSDETKRKGNMARGRR